MGKSLKVSLDFLWEPYRWEPYRMLQ
jgi:hypothetical protein